MAGFEAPAETPAPCLGVNLPPPGGFGRVWSAAFFARSARSIGVSASSGLSVIAIN